MRKSRRLVLLLGVLAVSVAGAVSAAVLTTSSSSSALGHSLKRGDAPAIARFEANGERSAVTFAEEDYSNRAYPSSNINFAQLQAAHDAATRINARVGQGSNLNSWQSLGPNGINVDPLATQTDGPATNWSGRITAIGINPTCTKYNCRVYVAAAGGGIWRANDGLAMHPTWKQISDGQIPSNAIGYLLVDPTDPSGATIYAGTGEPNGSSDSEAGVGVYRSTDYGDHWSLLPGSLAVAQDRAVGGIAIDPNNRNHIFIATDEARHGLSSNSGGRFTPPGAPLIGVYASTNGGGTFSPNLILPQDSVNPGSTTGGDTQYGGAMRIVYDPWNSSRLFVAVDGYGLYRSSNNGGSWEQIYQDTTDCQNCLVTPRRFDFATAKLTNGKTRIYLLDGQSGGTFYRVDDASASAASLTTGGTNGGWTKLSSTNNTQPGYIEQGICDGQCWYDMYVMSPAGHPDEVVVAGSMQYGDLVTRTSQPWSNGRAVVMSTDAGVHFTDMTGDATPRSGGYLWNYEDLHPDQHALAFDPANPDIMFFGEDGGITRTSGTWTNFSSDCANRNLSGQNLTNCQQVLSKIPTQLIPINYGLNDMQPQSVSVNVQNPLGDLLTGTQDNGTPEYQGSPTWFLGMSGDGGDSGFDPNNGNIRFHTYTDIFSDINFHGSNPQDWDWWVDPMANSGEFDGFYSPFIADTVTSGQYFAGMDSVWRTQDSGGSQSFLDNHCNTTGLFGTSDHVGIDCGDWVKLASPSQLNSSTYGSDKGANSNSSNYVVALSRGYDGSTLWAATRRGRVFVSSNANANPASSVVWHRIDTAAQPTRFVSSIAVDRNNPNHAIVTYSGYNAYAIAAGTAPGHVFDVVYNPVTHTATWTNIDQNLGDQPVLDAVYDWRQNIAFISTDWGVYQYDTVSNDWDPAGINLPSVAVYGLTLAKVGTGNGAVARVLYAATHGRGIYRLQLPAK
jgi:hypothetical protein